MISGVLEVIYATVDIFVPGGKLKLFGVTVVALCAEGCGASAEGRAASQPPPARGTAFVTARVLLSSSCRCGVRTVEVLTESPRASH
jgi:hypothetical protein